MLLAAILGAVVGAILEGLSLMAAGAGEGCAVPLAITVPYCLVVPLPLPPFTGGPLLWGAYYAVSARYAVGVLLGGAIVLVHGLGALIAIEAFGSFADRVPAWIFVAHGLAFVGAVAGCWWVGRSRDA